MVRRFIALPLALAFAVKAQAAHAADRPASAEKAAPKVDAAKGQQIGAACHGPAGAGIPAQYPRIGGQFAEYAEAQLKAFRAGERANNPNRMMRAVADRMSDAEIKAVSDYITGLRKPGKHNRSKGAADAALFY